MMVTEAEALLEWVWGEAFWVLLFVVLSLFAAAGFGWRLGRGPACRDCG